MNSCLTCPFFGSSSLQIRRKHVRRAGAIKELHIKNTDKLPAKKKQSLDERLINELRFRSIYCSKLSFYPAAVANATDQTDVYHGKVRKAGHIKKDWNYGKVYFAIVKKAQVRPQQIFAILTKNMEKLIFDQLCYTVRKSVDNYYFCSDLLSWAKLLKNDFWSHLLNRAKIWKIATSIEFAIGSKSIQKFAFDRIAYLTNISFKIKFVTPVNPLKK